MQPAGKTERPALVVVERRPDRVGDVHRRRLGRRLDAAAENGTVVVQRQPDRHVNVRHILGHRWYRLHGAADRPQEPPASDVRPDIRSDSPLHPHAARG